MKTQHIVVSAFIYHQGKALIAQRAAKENFPNAWEQFGGSIEWGENPIDGLIREVQEEAGLKIQPLYPYGVYNYFSHEDRHLVEIAFVCEVLGSTAVTLSHEHQAYAWLSESEIKSRPDLDEHIKNEVLSGFDFLRRQSNPSYTPGV